MTKQQLIEENMALVHFVIQKYYPWHTHDEDIIQIGMVGLCKAADKWDSEKGSFSTYAIQRIRGEISLHFKQEKKRISTVSLDSLVAQDTEDGHTFHDVTIGEQDVEYVDYKYLYEKLSPLQQQIFDLKLSGLMNFEIAKKLNFSREYIRQQVRLIQLKWDKYMEKG